MRPVVSEQEIRARYADRPVGETLRQIFDEGKQRGPDGKRNHALTTVMTLVSGHLYGHQLDAKENRAPENETFGQLEKREPRKYQKMLACLLSHHGFRHIWTATATMPSEFKVRLNARKTQELLDGVLSDAELVRPGGAHVRGFNAARHRLTWIRNELQTRISQRTRGYDADLRFDDLQALDPRLYAETARILYQARKHRLPVTL